MAGQPMPPGQGGPPQGQIPPEVLQALMAQQGGGQAPPQAPPQAQPVSPEEIITIIQGLQNGELTPQDLPPEVLAQVEEFIAQQGGGQGQAPQGQAPQGQVPEELALIIEGLQSGDLRPEDVPPEILAQVEAIIQGQQQ
jgi:hypothetical protein